MTFQTKLATRLNNEFTTKLGLDADVAGLLAAGVDNGTMKAAQARMVAGLSADWSEANLSDAHSSGAPKSQGKQRSREDRATAGAMVQMSKTNADAAHARQQLKAEFGVGYESLLTADDRDWLAD